MRVQVEAQADWEFGLLLRKHRGDGDALAALRLAYYAIVLELRSGNHSIWSMISDLDPDSFVSYYPPLLGHFRKIGEDQLAIFAFTEMDSEIPQSDLE